MKSKLLFVLFILSALGGCIPDSYDDCPELNKDKGDIDITIDTEIKPDMDQNTELP